MRSSLRSLFTVATVLALLCLMTVGLTSCREVPTVMIDPVDTPSGGQQTPAVTNPTYVTQPTVPTPEGHLAIPDLMRLHGETMLWSDLEPYTHTMLDDYTAQFPVFDTYGKTCTLTVAIDYDTGYLTEATLSYGEVSSDIMTSSLTCFSSIMQALENDTAASSEETTENGDA